MGTSTLVARSVNLGTTAAAGNDDEGRRVCYPAEFGFAYYSLSAQDLG